jgi:sRNA-binding carbon storage regulator CsrA
METPDGPRRGKVVLTRREGETVWFTLDGQTLGFVEVVTIKGSKVSLASTFDTRVRITRTEPVEVQHGS